MRDLNLLCNVVNSEGTTLYHQSPQETSHKIGENNQVRNLQNRDNSTVAVPHMQHTYEQVQYTYEQVFGNNYHVAQRPNPQQVYLAGSMPPQQTSHVYPNWVLWPYPQSTNFPYPQSAPTLPQQQSINIPYPQSVSYPQYSHSNPPFQAINQPMQSSPYYFQPNVFSSSQFNFLNVQPAAYMQQQPHISTLQPVASMVPNMVPVQQMPYPTQNLSSSTEIKVGVAEDQLKLSEPMVKNLKQPVEPTKSILKVRMRNKCVFHSVTHGRCKEKCEIRKSLGGKGSDQLYRVIKQLYKTIPLDILKSALIQFGEQAPKCLPQFLKRRAQLLRK